ncbi:LacI family DNA-binding transcriptional regulator [Prosthecomicrobium hirschii]|uniref:LacI family transcriptional regulator n=1 Tax=Prosthecodimorpha hirschii TaxID=665126 RepID=A0A0P6W700_9HYPH|nr:LacI family DNA-binding transcriptional regulator [Prosthecomicrobium hirschii]KPL54358.1 LacI family transcriptional regulator [Prosthecomicrobium hirschii]MCW1840806.1 LacI family DNA-binding transcriptional regulator [Prosthecomicrobium hirschii]TPQ51429.1 LacI family DNA-binding transcriptional regulator [Prosthecomicrobium hirschii]
MVINDRERPVPAVTIADVARLAGVGESTVSRVLRRSGSYSEETRDKVLRAVSALGYVPNRIAGALASTESDLVALIVPSLANIVFPDVLRGASVALESSGFQSVIGVTDYEEAREEDLIASVLAWRPRALILAGLEHTDRSRAMIAASGVRVAEILDLDGQGIDHVVGFSQHAAGRDTARHLVGRGRRRLAYLGIRLPGDSRARKRHEGFLAGLAEAGLSPADQELVPAPSSAEAGRIGLATLLARTPDLDAVYFVNDDMAIGGYFHCLAEGITVPDRLALFGFNGLEVGQALPQPLSTIRTPRYRAGEVAAGLLLAQAPATVVDTGYELVPGATS